MNCSRSRSMALRSVRWPFLRTASGSSPGADRWFFLRRELNRFIPAAGIGRLRFGSFPNDKEVLTLKGHTNRVFSAAFSPDGQRVVTGSLDQTARIWDAAAEGVGNPQRARDGIRSVAFSPDGQRIVTGSFDRTAKVWDVDERQAIGHLRSAQHLVMSAAFSPGWQANRHGRPGWDCQGLGCGQRQGTVHSQRTDISGSGRWRFLRTARGF